MNPVKIYFSLIVCGLFWAVNPSYAQPATGNTKDALIKSNALRYETIGALRGMLSQIAWYNLPFDYVKDQERQISDMTLEQHKTIAQKYIHPDKMIYLIAGDKATQMEKLKELGFGDPILLDKDGNIQSN